MLKKILQAAGIGLCTAGLIIGTRLYFQPDNSNFPAQSNLTIGISSFHDAIALAAPAVVNIYSQVEAKDVTADLVNTLGSGVIVSADGYILTNKHVIEEAEEIIIALQNGMVFKNVKLVGDDTLTDLAVLKIEAENLPVIPQNAARRLRIGDVVLAIGNPLNLGQSITQGIVSAIGRNALVEGGRQNFIQTDASINQGNSGGALINSAGELVGISTLRLGRTNDELAEGLNFAIPINLANQVMEKIIKDGRVIRGFFGVTSLLMDVAKQRGYEKGVIISGVSAGGPAELAGIKAGDLILKIGEIEALSPSQMMDVLGEMQPYVNVDVLVQRDDQLLTFNVTISEYPEEKSDTIQEQEESDDNSEE